MARKLTDLTQATTLSADDLFYLVNNPSGTKDDRSLSAATLFAGVTGNLAAAGPDPWFDVTNPAYGAFSDGTNANATTAGIKAAITAANQISISNSARGAIVWFPPGQYSVNDTLTTPGPGVTLLGAISSGIGNSASASMIKFTTNAPLFDLGNQATSNVHFMWLDFEGSNATNLLQRAIVGAAVTAITIEHCSFDQWGGQCIKFDAGSDVTIRECLVENCLKYYVNQSGDPPAAYVGAIQLGSLENIVEYNNINGVAGMTTGNAGTGFMLAAYFTNVENTLRFNTFAFADRGVRIEAGFLNVLVQNRFEYCQREGLVSLGYESVYLANRFGDNSMGADNTYIDCIIGDGATNGYGNIFADNISIHTAVNSGTFRPSYNFFINGSGGADATHHNEVYNNRGNSAHIAVYAPFTGTAPVALSQLYIEVANSGGTGSSFTFGAQSGLMWTATVTSNISGVANLEIKTPTNPLKGQRSTLKIVNSAGVGAVLTTAFDPTNHVFKVSGYTDPANGFFKTGEFYYDGTNWIQIGAWSADITV